MKRPKSRTAEDLGAAIIGSIDEELRAADDRVLAILGAAYLDSVLEQLLRATFVDNEEEANGLLNPDRAIGANGARYQLAYCLGLITKDERDDLKLVAKIRNQFAHDFECRALTDEPARSLINSLHFVERRRALEREFVSSSSLNEGKTVQTGPRELLRDAVLDLFVALLPLVRDVRRGSRALWYPDAADGMSAQQRLSFSLTNRISIPHQSI